MPGRKYASGPQKQVTTLLRVLLVLVITVILSGCSLSRPNISKAAAVDRPKETVSPGEAGPVPLKQGTVEVELSLVGDIMLHVPQLNAAYDKSTGSYSFDEFFSEVQDYLRAADLTIGNLETTLAGRERGYSGYPQFNSPSEILTALKNAGFDILTTANNHSMDRGVPGVLNTIANLDASGIKHTGTFTSLEERNKPLIADIRGLKVAILAYTYGTNGIPVPKDRSYLVNLIDLARIREDIQQARLEGADLVLLLPHFGVEYRRVPGPEEKKLVDNLFKAGADIVAGSHPHVIQPMVRRDLSGDSEGLFAAYSMGNFISAQRAPYKDSGIILNLKLEKDLASGDIRLIGADYIPTWVHRYRANGKNMYRVVPVEKAIREYEQGRDRKIRAVDYQRLKQVWQETTSLLSGPQSPSTRHI